MSDAGLRPLPGVSHQPPPALHGHGGLKRTSQRRRLPVSTVSQSGSETPASAGRLSCMNRLQWTVCVCLNRLQWTVCVCMNRLQWTVCICMNRLQ